MWNFSPDHVDMGVGVGKVGALPWPIIPHSPEPLRFPDGASSPGAPLQLCPTPQTLLPWPLFQGGTGHMLRT